MSTPAVRRLAGDQGMALIAVLLLLMLVSALCTALTMASGAETMIARNHQSSGEARAAAEGGLSHAVQVTIANLRDWQTNGLASRSAAMTAILRGPDNLAGTGATNADNGSLEAYGIPRPPGRVTLGRGAYEALVLDEDDPQRGLVLSAADRTRIGEDGQPFTDLNTVVVVRAVGYGSGGTVAIVEAAVSPLILPAVVANQPLVVSGSALITGVKGSVHSNSTLTLSGSADIAEDATASGAYVETGHPSVGGLSGGNFGAIAIPPVRAADYRARADFILTADGEITGPDNTVTKAKGNAVCNAKANAKACTNSGLDWEFEASTGWTLSGNSAPLAGTYYVEGHVNISGSPGSKASPVQLSIVAEGNIDISGSPHLMPKDLEVLFVTDMDLRIVGNFSADSAVEGQVLVREQVSITGSATLAGQILVDGAASVSNLVTDNLITGNATVTYNGTSGGSGFTVSAWRQIR